LFLPLLHHPLMQVRVVVLVWELEKVSELVLDWASGPVEEGV
jgi:hypothetical protein